jgi:hypothetical protein
MSASHPSVIVWLIISATCVTVNQSAVSIPPSAAMPAREIKIVFRQGIILTLWVTH